MRATTPRWSVALVVPRGQQYLAIARHFNPRDVNLIGGDAEPEDTEPVQTAIRELFEESGLRTQPHQLQLLEAQPNERGRLTYAYLVKAYRGRLRSSEEGKPFWTAQLHRFSSPSSTFSKHNLRLVHLALMTGRTSSWA